jgi:hypothetical protein
MQFAAAILLTLSLIASPVGCSIRPCDLGQSTHDCCPRTPSPTSCPYDILSLAKTVPAQVAVAVIYAVDPLAPPQSEVDGPVGLVVPDQRGLHLENRVSPSLIPQ